MICLDIILLCRIYQLGSPVLSLSISCFSENCANALREDGVQITIVHNTQVQSCVEPVNMCYIRI